MGRMHAPGKGISGSALPYKKTPPSWLKTTAQEVRRLPVVARACGSALQGWQSSSPRTLPLVVHRLRLRRASRLLPRNPCGCGTSCPVPREAGAWASGPRVWATDPPPLFAHPEA